MGHAVDKANYWVSVWMSLAFPGVRLRSDHASCAVKAGVTL